MKHKKLLSFFAAGCIVFSVANAQSSNKLVLNKGQKIQVDNSMKSVISMEMMGQSMEMTSDVLMINQVEVKDKSDTAYTVNSAITKMTTNGSAMGQNYTFDSDKKEDLESEIGKALKGQINVTKEMHFNKAGELTSVTKTTDSSAASGSPLDMMKSMTSAGGDESGGISEIFKVLPKGKKVGDSWSDSLISADAKLYRTYTLKELKGDDAIVTLSGKQTTNKKVEQQGMEVNVTMDSKIAGEMTVDQKTGIVKQRSLTMDGTGNADAMGQAIPLTTKITSTTSVKNL